MGFRVAAIEVCCYSFYEAQDRKFALVELSSDVEDSKSVNCLKLEETFKEAKIEIHMIPDSEDDKQQMHQALMLVGLSPLLSETELMYLLRERMGNPAPTPLKVQMLYRTDVSNAGLGIALYPSFNTALEAKRSLNIPDSTLARFLGS